MVLIRITITSIWITQLVHKLNKGTAPLNPAICFWNQCQIPWQQNIEFKYYFSQRPHTEKQKVLGLSALVMNSLIFFPFSLEHSTKEKEISVRKFTFSKIGYSALKRVQANWTISSLVPGSCPPNWLHGKARISKPEVASN